MNSSVTTNFPITVLTPIATTNSAPTFLSIRTAQKELNSNAASVHSYEGGAMHGLLCLTLTPQAYLAIAGVPFIPPAVPPAQPMLQGLNTAAQIAQAVRQHIEDRRVFTEYRDTDKALVRLLLAAVPIQYVKALEHEDLGYSGLTCIEILTHLHAEYGQISLHDTEQNQERMNAPWHPPTPIEDLFAQLDNGVIFAVAAGEPIVDRQVARIGYNIIMRTGQFTQACREWRLKPPAEQTYAQFKIFFHRMNMDQQQTTTTTMAGFGTANATTVVGAANATTVVANVYPSSVATTIDNTNSIAQSSLTNTQQQANSVAQLSTELASLMREVKYLRAQVKTTKKPAVTTPTTLSYCWTHGFTKNTRHNSQTCTNQAEGHQVNATAGNTLGGTATECKPRQR
jgi:hypothetical protein